MQISQEQLKRIVEQGPPKKPGEEAQGHLLGLYLANIERLKKERNLEQIGAEECAGIAMHILDLLNWQGAMNQYNQLKAALEQSERRIQLVKQ